MSSGCAHPVDHCMCAHRVDHWMCAPSGPLDVCICITTTCKHPRAHRKPYIRWSTRCSYIWWTTSSPLVVIRMQRHLVDHRMCKSPVISAIYIEGTRLNFELARSPWQPVRFFENNSEIHDICWGIMNKYFLILWILPSGFGWNWCQNWRFILSTMCANDRNFRVSTRPLRPILVLFVTTFEQKHRFLQVHFEAVITIF